ncbi:hypothetical protein IW492_12740 [Enterococcus sp. BWB1-3]|uniref:hypothetical protein n=1 Tax=Enterococcus sp. BWB1-3 TaxID=2787713 RepID=UPI0019248C9E|nr:hypothetical protein [Enterococcus sp. BWB1-3]MBL1230099.1 hypothetical protein [Enterococcus sp. BWB1-3]
MFDNFSVENRALKNTIYGGLLAKRTIDNELGDVIRRESSVPFLGSGDKTKTHTPEGSLSMATVTEQTDVPQLFIETVKKLLPFQNGYTPL